MATYQSESQLRSGRRGRTSQGASASPHSTSQLSMEQKMLLGTLTSTSRSMSAYELTNHWTPTWSLREVTKFLDDLVKSGHLRAEGRHVKFYSVSVATICKKVGSQ